MSESITPEQEAALDQAMKILNEHFEASLIVARATDDNQRSNYPSNWHGHLSDIRGLISIAGVRIDAALVKTLVEED